MKVFKQKSWIDNYQWGPTNNTAIPQNTLQIINISWNLLCLKEENRLNELL